MENHQIEEHQDERLKRRKRPIGAPPFKKTKTRYVWLNVLPDDLWLNVREGETIWEAMQNENVELGGSAVDWGNAANARSRFSLR